MQIPKNLPSRWELPGGVKGLLWECLAGRWQSWQHAGRGQQYLWRRDPALHSIHTHCSAPMTVLCTDELQSQDRKTFSTGFEASYSHWACKEELSFALRVSCFCHWSVSVRECCCLSVEHENDSEIVTASRIGIVTNLCLAFWNALKWLMVPTMVWVLQTTYVGLMGFLVFCHLTLISSPQSLQIAEKRKHKGIV